MLADLGFINKSKENTFADWKERYDRICNNLSLTCYDKYDFLNFLRSIYGSEVIDEFEIRYELS